MDTLVLTAYGGERIEDGFSSFVDEVTGKVESYHHFQLWTAMTGTCTSLSRYPHSSS